MANLLHYVEEFRDCSFHEQEVGPTDILVLTEIGYLPFDGILSAEFCSEHGLSLADLARAYSKHYGERPFSASACKNRILLLKKVAKAQRFKDIKVFAFVNNYSFKEEKQFSSLKL